MNRDDIIRMAEEAGIVVTGEAVWKLCEIVAAAERNKVAQWMIDHGFATGHGDTTEDLLEELDWQITESWSKVVMASVKAEREACAKLCDEYDNGRHANAADLCATAIRARGEK